MKSSRTIAMLVVIALMLSAGCFVEVPSEKPVSRPKAVCPRPVQPIQMEPMSDPDEFDDQGPYMDLEPNIIVPTDYPSIQEAEDNSCVGDVILVRPGTYLESVTIDTEGLYLLGEGSSMTRIVSPLGPAVRIAADGVSVNSVGMEGGGVLMDHVIGAYLISSSVSNTMVGATLIGTTESHVMGTTFQSVQVGIKIGSMSNDNEIGPSNSLSQLNVGITVEGDSRNNEIFQNRLTQAGMGILVDQSPNNLLHHNTFSDIGGFAVEIHGGSDTTVLSGNEAWDVMGGFSVDDTNDVTLIGNAMSATGDSVILHNVVKASLRNNSLLSSVHAALLIESGTQDVTVEDNVFRASPFGIQADGVVGLRVEGNQFGGGEVGLEVTSGGSPTIVDNRFSHQSRASLRLLSSPSATVSDNQFLKGLDWSIEAIGSTDIKIQGNSILSHQDGIFLENANDATIENNEVKSSGTGIQITTSPGTGVSGNTLARNDVGVELQSNGVSLHHNWLADNLLQVGQSMIGQNSWDDGSGHGNFWSDYDGEDLDYDGVGDTLIPHLGVDSFPLMKEDFDSFQIFIDLVEEARSKILASGIHHGIQNSLIKKLDHSQRSIMRNENPQSARGPMNAFCNEVDAQAGKKIPPGLAVELAHAGLEIEAAFGDIDFDDDGLKTSTERIIGTDPHDPDSDGDFASDGCEHWGGLDPLDDTDGILDVDTDGLVNWLECLLRTTLNDKDTDDDAFDDNMIDGVEFGYWPLRDPDMDFDFFQDLALDRLDPFKIPCDVLDEDCLHLDDWTQVEEMTEYLVESDSDGDRFLDGWERYMDPEFDPLVPDEFVFRRDFDRDIISNYDEHQTWMSGLDTDPRVQDVIVEVDWISGLDPRSDTKTFIRRPLGDPNNALSWVAGANGIPDNHEPAVVAFDLEGMNLLLIYDDELPGTVDGADNVISASEANRVFNNSFDGGHWESVLHGISRYTLLVYAIDVSGCRRCGGKSGDPLGNHTDYFLVAAGAATQTPRRQAMTLMHELGHNLGLQHGGAWKTNYKLNYNGIMNYRYAWPTCGSGVVDYSHGLNPPLDESIGQFNMKCDGTLVPHSVYADNVTGEIAYNWKNWTAGKDIDFDPLDSNLYDYDDWAYVKEYLDVWIVHRLFKK